jgi:hypothetical protein
MCPKGQGQTSAGISVSKGFKRLNHCIMAEPAPCTVMVVAVTPVSVSSVCSNFLEICDQSTCLLIAQTISRRAGMQRFASASSP